ncbi:hypothetical protein ACLB2K_042052 [Fragaria x ananassa]
MESDDNEQVYIPQVKSVLVPKLQQEFGIIDEVADFYNRYAKETRFSIRSHTSAMNKDNTTLMMKEYVCYKQGNSKVQGEKRKRGLPKVGCKARIAAMRRSGGYAISIFVECHNHPLTSPVRLPFLKSHNGVSNLNKTLSDQSGLVNVKTHKRFELFGVQASGIEHIGCTLRDLYNYGRTCREEKKGHDRDLLYIDEEKRKVNRDIPSVPDELAGKRWKLVNTVEISFDQSPPNQDESVIHGPGFVEEKERKRLVVVSSPEVAGRRHSDVRRRRPREREEMDCSSVSARFGL